ncbi:hypothetical protein QOT17_007972 [Balamuthia mandrillaris]
MESTTTTSNATTGVATKWVLGAAALAGAVGVGWYVLNRKVTVKKRPEDVQAMMFRFVCDGVAVLRDSSAPLERQIEAAMALHKLSLMADEEAVAAIYKAFRQAGGQKTMFELLQKHFSIRSTENKAEGDSSSSSSSNAVAHYLLRTIANLSLDDRSREEMLGSKRVSELVSLYWQHTNAAGKDSIMRALMNMSVDFEGEEVVRKEGGLEAAIRLFVQCKADAPLLLTCSRLLCNLIANDTNRALMVEAGVTDHAIELFNNESLSGEVLKRVCRLLFYLAAEPNNEENFGKIVNRKMGQRFVRWLRRWRTDESTVYSVLEAISKIAEPNATTTTPETSSFYTSAIHPFQDAFLPQREEREGEQKDKEKEDEEAEETSEEREEEDSGISIICSLLSSNVVNLQMISIFCLDHLMQNNERMIAHVQRDATAVNSLMQLCDLSEANQGRSKARQVMARLNAFSVTRQQL